MAKLGKSQLTFERKPTILIAGTPFVGKTRVANKLVNLTGFDVIHCDIFRKSFWFIADEQKRSSERYRKYGEAISQRRKGLILEGDDLIGRNRGDTELVRQGLITNDSSVSLTLVVHLKSQPNAKAFILGFIKPDLVAVVAELRANRLMTMSNHDLRQNIKLSARRSEQLRSMAGEARIPFIEMSGHDPDSAIEAAARRILRDVDCPLWHPERFGA